MSIVILDTGCANLASVKYAIERLGYQPIVTADPDRVLTAKSVFLPGVGTAKSAMDQLQKRSLISLIKACTQPVLGICLGMQILANDSEECNTQTLGIVDSSVRRINDYGLPLPHMGWNRVLAQPDNALFKNIADNSHFYFVHGFCLPLSKATVAETEYGEKFSAAIQKDNFFGVQFHPERSGQAGAQLLKNFLEM